MAREDVMSDLVLIVDDDDDVGITISVFLEMSGIDSVDAKSGIEALELIKNNKNIKFVISDIRMANGSGIFLLEELRKIDPVFPHVVLISGQTDFSKEDAIKKGALDFFQKPANIEEIINLIRAKL